jgi:hypothetical protein
MSFWLAARISAVEPRKFVAPRTFAGRKKSCMFGFAPRSRSSCTISSPVV